MSSSRALGFIAVFILSILGASFVSVSSSAAPSAPVTATESEQKIQTAEVIKVLVSQKPIAAGSFIDKGDLVFQEKVVSRSGYIQSDIFSVSDFNGAVVLADVANGEAIQYADIVRLNQQGFLAAVLAPGQRAVSIPVNEVTANAGLIGPGDYVDLLLTLYADSERGARDMNRGRDISMLTSKTLASAIRVIAINRQSVADREHELGSALTTATLEVPPRLAQQLTLASHMGELSLSLRSKREPGFASQAEEVWSGDVHSASNQLKPEPGLVLMRGGTTQIIGYPKKETKQEEKE